MNLKIKSIIPVVTSIILTGLLPSLLAGLVPLPFYILAIIICVFLAIIFSLIQALIISKTAAPLEKSNIDLQAENTQLKEEKEKLQEEATEKGQIIDRLQRERTQLEQEKKKLQKEVVEKDQIIEKYTHNSYAATGIVFNNDYTKILLAYHARQKRWIPPGSHVEGVQYFHEVVLESATRETGYTVRFHESHDYEKYVDANCCVVPCPFSVQVETQIDGEGHEIHYDALYILIADEHEEILKPGTHKTKWLSISKLDAFAKRNDTYPDVVQSVNDALKFINEKKGETQNED